MTRSNLGVLCVDVNHDGNPCGATAGYKGTRCSSHEAQLRMKYHAPVPHVVKMGVGACPRCRGYVDRDPGMIDDGSVYAKCRNCGYETAIGHQHRRGVSA